MDVPQNQAVEHNVAEGNNVGNREPGANNNRVPNVGPQQNPLIGMRDRLFQALFYRVSLTYARAFPHSVRRFIEFALLLKVSTCYVKIPF